jgi:hypothetical protein
MNHCPHNSAQWLKVAGITVHCNHTHTQYIYTLLLTDIALHSACNSTAECPQLQLKGKAWYSPRQTSCAADTASFQPSYGSSSSSNIERFLQDGCSISSIFMKPGIKPLYSHLKTSVFYILSASVRCAGELVGLHTPENTSFLCFFVHVYLFIYLSIYLFLHPMMNSIPSFHNVTVLHYNGLTILASLTRTN